VAVLDIGMPTMDGHEAARAIRALPGGQSVYLIALSGWGRPEDIEHSISCGFNQHLTKPANIEKLLTLVGEVQARAVV
jgi:CheY-like chemotaxis protein